MGLAAILKRLKEIKEELNVEGADLEALKTEARSLMAEKEEIEKRAEERTALIDEVTGGIGTTVVRTFETDRKEIRSKVSEELETRAFLKNLLGEDLNEEEHRALAHD